MTALEVLVPGVVFGLANSAHCAGMCGAFALRSAAGPSRPALGTALYLSGKAFTYVTLGAIAGTVGSRVFGSFAGLQTALGVAVGGILLVVAWSLLRPAARVRAHGPFTRALGALVSPIFRAANDAERVAGPFGLGAATGLLPCGVVYVAVLQAAALGTGARGAGLMAAFALGTVPVLAATALLGGRVIARVGPARLRVAGGVVVAIAGVAGITRALLPLVVSGADGGAICCH